MRATPLLMLAFACQLLSAQEKLLPVYRFEHIGRSDGLIVNELRSKIVRDRRGFIWIGTGNGLARFDGHTCKVYRNNPDDSSSLSSNHIPGLLSDSRGYLWVGTLEVGLSIYDSQHDHFLNIPPRRDDPAQFQMASVSTIFEDRSGHIWLGSFGGEGLVRISIPDADPLRCVDSLSRHLRFRAMKFPGAWENVIDDIGQLGDGAIIVASRGGLIIADSIDGEDAARLRSKISGTVLDSTWVTSFAWETRSRLWVSTASHGLFLIDFERDTLINHHKRAIHQVDVGDDPIYSIQIDRTGFMWIGATTGLDLFDPVSGKYVDYLHDTTPPTPSAFGFYLSLDETGTVWAATGDNGAFYLPPGAMRIPHYGIRVAEGRPAEMSTLTRWDDGTFWIGAEGVAVQVDPATLSVLRSVDILRGDKSAYGIKGFWDSYRDRHNHIWYGAWGPGLYEFDPASGRVANFRFDREISQTGNKISVCRSLAGGSGDTILIATHNLSGLVSFDARTHAFSPVFSRLPECVAHVMRDSRGSFWITDEFETVLVYDPLTGSVKRFTHRPGDPRSLPRGRPWSSYEDAQGRVWIGCGSTVALFEPETETFRHFVNAEFEGSIFAHPRGSDRKGRIWVQYYKDFAGLSMLDPSTGVFKNIDFASGLCGQVHDMEVLADGRLLMVGFIGLNIIDPDRLFIPRSPPLLSISRISVNDAKTLPPQIEMTSSRLELPYDQNTIELEFAAIDPGFSRLIRYSYRLEGLEEDWVTPIDRRYVRYPGLDPGQYTFRVRAVSIRDEWPPQETAVAIVIAPPWWRAWWAYAAYALALAGLSLASFRTYRRQTHLKQQVAMERFQAEHLAEVDRLKSRFFSNVSHEFRTPLTLILGPAEQGLGSTNLHVAHQKFRLVRDNARKLLSLVNQLLDFSRLESGMMKLQVSEGNIEAFVRRVVMSFESWAERDGVTLHFMSELNSTTCYFDSDKIEKIVNNLLSNALKFTPEGGAVTVTVGESRPSGSELGDVKSAPLSAIVISVSDTGPGIPPEHLPHIFDRFYRVGEMHASGGTGIGLALVEELVKLHRGSVTVKSSAEKGSEFTIVVPGDKSAYGPGDIAEVSPAAPRPEEPVVPVISDGNPIPLPRKPVDGKPTVLIVEDNADLREYIREYMDSDYSISEAGNGRSGFETATETLPDLIISDVMMPEMDGIELCRALKRDVRTSHIPVILLTARAGTDSRIEGLESGADDYVTKPFDSHELAARVRNLIEQRELLRSKFANATLLKPGDVTVTSLDDKLLRKAMETVETRMGSEDFSVEELAREVGLSPRHLNRKLQSLTNLSSRDFIRYVRLQRAYALLQQNAGSVAEIAYQVGIGSPAHFAAAFHKRFGCRPSDIRKKDA